MASAVSRREVDVNHFTPRDYQIELLDVASKVNTIVQLGTGAGKTFIAVLLIKEYGAQVFLPLSEGGKRIFFIVDKVSLVAQQAEHIQLHTTMNVGKLHGSLNQNVWQDRNATQEFFENHHVTVLTAQIFLDLLSHAFFDLKNAALIVFDECHHALGSKHQFRLIMDQYRKLPNDDNRPRILGLTASLINNKTPPNQLDVMLTKLERVMSAQIATASTLVGVSKYGTKCEVIVIVARKFDFNQGRNGEIIRFLDQYRHFCHNTQEFHPDLDIDPRKYVMEAVNRTIASMKQGGPWCAWKVAQLMETQQCKSKKQGHLPEKTVDFFELGESAMGTVRRVLESTMRSIRSLEALSLYVPHKMMRLFDILKQYHPSVKPDDDKLCGIIFVDQRMMAFVMKHLLKAVARWEPELNHLKVDFVVGFSGSTFSDSSESQSLHKRQDAVLRKFRHGELNLLVATNVLEEGIDVGSCNLVIKFDRPADYRAYVQSKGRARKRGARFVMLIEEDDVQQCNEDLRDFNEIERILLRRYRSVHNPCDILIENVDDVIPPYVVESGAQINLSGAIALVNRYCSMLPSDIFTRLVPENRIVCVPSGNTVKYTAELFLPINSPIKRSIRLNTPVESKKLAQMAVALETCKELHRAGELNEYLLPVGKDTVAKLMTQLDDDPDEYMPGVQAKVGSAKRKQLYDKKIARCLNEALPRVQAPSFIYVMEMELLKEPPVELNPKRRKFAKPSETECCFGFLSGTRLPKIPPFPAYLRQGDMRVHVRPAKSTVTLTDHHFQLLKQFHHYLFRNVLLLTKANLDFLMDPETPMNTLIVPLTRVVLPDGTTDFSIKMDYVTEVVKCMTELPRVPTEEERSKYKFNKEDYIDSVVMPWYRNTEQPTFYYVAEIIEDRTPSSKFPDEHFSTFNEYFDKKYNLKIYDQEQHLLDVDYTSTRMNLLLPRARGPRKTSRSADNSQQQILVPELMDRHPIKAHLWNTVCALPCFFYRVNHLLLADELRQKICRDALEIVNPIPPDDFHWAPLAYPATYEEKQSLVVSRIQQLREENKKRQILAGVGLPPPENGEPSFEIGVWDPELACGLEWQQNDVIGVPPPGPQMTPEQMADVDMEDSIGLVPTTASGTGDLSDDEDGEAVVLMDFAKHISATNANYESFAAPRPEVIEKSGGWDCGWDIEIPSADGALQMLTSAANQFDFRGLVEDIEKHVLETKVGDVVPEKGSSQSKKDEKVETKMDVSPPENGATVPAPGASREKPVDLLTGDTSIFDGVELQEDHDRVLKPEEVVDLIDFDDKLDSDDALPPSAPVECDSDEEFSVLSEGERKKRNLDLIVADRIELPSLSKGEVLAPCAQASFSFSGVSPSVSRMSLLDGSIARTGNQESKRLRIDDDVMDTSGPLEEEGNGESSAGSETGPCVFAGSPYPVPTEESCRYGVSPCFLLQALTTSNANDGINLERLETIGDSFLKYSVTDYLYHMHPAQHEGKLSFARSKEVSNCNLYRLGKRIGLPSLIVGSKFDVQDSWLPPCYIPNNSFKAPNFEDAEIADRIMEKVLDEEKIEDKVAKQVTGWDEADAETSIRKVDGGVEVINFPKVSAVTEALDDLHPLPYNMLTQQMISDKSIADAVEALIGAHLLCLGPEQTLKFMNWLGLKVLNGPILIESPLLRFIDTAEEPNLSERQLKEFWVQFQLAQLEEKIGYRFKEKAYLLQAFTHASFFRNRITGCYQRLEFLGDAVLDYMITRFLFEHERQYSPGVLTDLRSALVNNTIFASLAVKFDFHKHFVAICPGLHHMIEKFVKLCNEKNFCESNFNAEMYMVTTEEEYDEGQEEDIEVPKAMGDIFESVAGAIYLDSGRDLDAVWTVFYALMKPVIEECCANPPRSPIRELLELEPDKTRFSRMERIIETGKVRVTVDVNKGNQNFRFIGMGRNYRIAKATAAKRALRYLKSLEEQKLRDARKSKKKEAELNMDSF